MKTVFMSCDGKIFDTEKEALDHETIILSELIMVDALGRRTQETVSARVIWIGTPEANQMLFDMTKEQGDTELAGIEEEETGAFVWDEGLMEYRWLDMEDLVAIANLHQLLVENGSL